MNLPKIHHGKLTDFQRIKVMRGAECVVNPRVRLAAVNDEPSYTFDHRINPVYWLFATVAGLAMWGMIAILC